MKIEVLFKEIEKVLREKLDKDIDIEYLGPSKISLSILNTDFIIEVVEINGNKLTIEYDTGIVGKGLILGLLSISSGIKRAGHLTLEIDLTEFHEFFENISIKEITFTGYNTIIIEGCLL